ncbi:MAG: hypothetical protein QNI90_04920 [Dinoroseobacter sp.]|nr:hypothetical protein [Dinoroseobacter sp.]MDJ0992893.1 hypothetical protein [Dinoroseobacter sp.]
MFEKPNGCIETVDLPLENGARARLSLRSNNVYAILPSRAHIEASAVA